MLRLRKSVSVLIFGLVAARVLSGEAVAAETKCAPYSAAIEALFENAGKSGAFLTTIPASGMDRFIKLMSARGLEVTGEAALVWIGPLPGADKDVFSIYVKRGKQLCLGGAISLEKAKEGGKRPTTNPQGEWF